MWTTVAIQLETDIIWFDTGIGQSSQWAELWAVWLMATHEAQPMTICTAGGAVYQGLTLWISSRHANKWMVMHRPLWEQALWKDLWELGHQIQITAYHVTGHAPPESPGTDEADTLAKVWWLSCHLEIPCVLAVPASPIGREVAQWLCHRLLHAGQKTM